MNTNRHTDGRVDYNWSEQFHKKYNEQNIPHEKPGRYNNIL